MKTFKTFSTLMMIAASVALMSCDTGSNDDDGNAVVFKDQTLQGTFNNKPFSFVSGTVEASTFETGSYDLDLYNVASTGTGSWGPTYPFSGYLKVMTTVPAKIGRTDLSFSFDGSDNHTVTLYDPDAGSLNIIATIGAVEITAIDTAAKTVTGRIAAKDEEGNEVNGNFTATLVD
jgi:hypothetical protein